MSEKICFIGAGNLATHLAKAIQIEGNFVSQVYSRTEESGKALAEILSTKYVTSIAEIDKSADIFFVAVKDSAVDEVLSQIDLSGKLLVHCSGSLPLDVLGKYSSNYGVLYPLQTFSKTRYVEFSKIPVFIEANSAENEAKLMHLARQISTSVTLAGSEKRKTLHIAAVFACNFVNHFYSIASEILSAQKIPFDVLKPLILETAQKVQEISPKTAQTGPAVRFDENIISEHLKSLETFPNYHELYNTVSKSIFEYHKNIG